MNPGPANSNDPLQTVALMVPPMPDMTVSQQWVVQKITEMMPTAGPQGIQGVQGIQGAQGPAGAAGTNGTNGTNGATGATGAAGATGATGAAGSAGATGATGAVGPAWAFGYPSARADVTALATAYQASDPSKPAWITLNITSTASMTLGGGTNESGEVRVGSANTVAGGSSGAAVGGHRNSFTGTVVVGINMGNVLTAAVPFFLPAGGYFAVRRLTGSTMVIASAFEQQ